MSTRRFGTQSLVRLLGNWQESTSRTPLWRQLAEALRLLILDGRLTLQTRLPGERELAAALNVSRTTIASARSASCGRRAFSTAAREAVRALFYQNAPPTCRPLRHPLHAESLYCRPQRRAGSPSGLPACHDAAAALPGPDRLRSTRAASTAGGDCPSLQRTRGLPTRPDE